MSKRYVLQRRIKQVLFALIAWFVVHQVVIISDGLVDDDIQSNIAVVFGNTVNEDGSPSPRLKARLDKAIELYNSKTVRFLFVSGGLGKEGHLEGTKMAEYLVSQGIHEGAIFVDNKGNNTHQTAKNFRDLFPKKNEVILISQYHHLSRAKLAFRKIGIEKVGGVHAEYFELRDFYSCFREFFAYYSYLIKY